MDSKANRLETRGLRPGGIGSALLVAAALVVLVAGLRAARPALVPLVAAAFVAVPCLPLVGRLQRLGAPVGLAVAVVVLALAAAFVGVGVFLGTSLAGLTQALPAYEGALARAVAGLFVWLETYGVRVPDREGLLQAADPAAAFRLVARLLGELGQLLVTGLLLLVAVVFMLLEASGFRAKLTRAFGATRARSAAPAFAAFAAGVKQYLYIKTLVSLLTGTLVAVLLAALRVDFPLLWGFVAFLFNYIPNIGSMVAAVPGILLALIQYGPGVAALAGAGLFAINFGIGQVLEPRWMGRGVGLSPLMVLLALVFWTYVLGAVGLLLAVPLTMTLKIALEARGDTRWLAVLLGPDKAPTLTPELARGAPSAPDAEAALAGPPDEASPGDGAGPR